MDYDNVKSLTADLYDWYQLRVMDCGGSKQWYDFTVEYKFDKEEIEKKYARSEAKYFKRRLANVAMGQVFLEDAPGHDYKEVAQRTADDAKRFLDRAL